MNVAPHESRHVAMAVLEGAVVESVDVMGGRGFDGLCRYAMRVHDRDSALARARIVLAPFVAEGSAPPWPLRSDRSDDEADVARIADQIGMTQREYERVLRDTASIMREPRFKMLHAAIAAALRKDGFLTGVELRRIALKHRPPLEPIVVGGRKFASAWDVPLNLIENPHERPINGDGYEVDY